MQRIKTTSESYFPTQVLSPFSSSLSSSFSTPVIVKRNSSFKFDSYASEASKLLNHRASVSSLIETYLPGDEVGPYLLEKKIGSGAFSTVFQARIEEIKDSPIFAIKIINKVPSICCSQSFYRLNVSPDSAKAITDMVSKETKIWQSLKHPYILSLHDIVEGEDSYFVISEIASGGSLLEYLQQHTSGIPVQFARKLFRNAVEAVKYMHDRLIVHRDIKCENILLAKASECIPSEVFIKSLDNFNENENKISLESISRPKHMFSDIWDKEESQLGFEFENDEFNNSGSTQSNENQRGNSIIDITKYVAKLADFGFSSYVDCPNPEKTSCGSMHYCSPELLCTNEISTASDIWALGCVLYASLTGSLPFDDEIIPRLQHNISNGIWCRNGLDASVVDLLEQIFQNDKNKRIDINGILDHEWIKSA